MSGFRVLRSCRGALAPWGAAGGTGQSRSSERYLGAGERLAYAAQVESGGSHAGKLSRSRVKNHSGRAPEQTGVIFAASDQL